MNYSFNNILPSSVPVHPIPAASAAAPTSSNASSDLAFHPYAAAAPSLQQSSHLATGALAVVPPYAAAASVSYSYEDDDDSMPWERDGWVPLEKSGKQKTPNKIRGELQRYIDACKAGKCHGLSCLGGISMIFLIIINDV